MVSKLLIQEQDGTPEQIVFASHTPFSPAAAVDLRITTDGSKELDVEIDLTGVVDDEARQSAKFDFGEHRAVEYNIRASLEFAATPTAGETVELYLAPSQSSTPANGNAGNVSGVDEDYTGYSANLDASLLQLKLIGTFKATAQPTATVQTCECGVFSPGERYGTMIVVNRVGAVFHSDVIECHIVFDPILPEGQ